MKTISTAISDIDALDHELYFLDAKYRKEALLTNSDIVSLTDTAQTDIPSHLRKFIVSHPEFQKILALSTAIETKSVSLFHALMTSEDEKFIQAFFAYMQEQHAPFAYKDKSMTMAEIRAEKLTTLEQSCRKKIATDAKIFLSDLVHYKAVQKIIETKSKERLSIEGQEIPVSQLRWHFQRAILSTIAEKGREKRTTQTGIAWDMGDELYSFIDSLSSVDLPKTKLSREEIIAKLKSNPDIQTLAEKYIFFKLIQRSAGKWYVLTQREIVLIHDILRDLQNGKVVLLTGDTGSGKTDLARFLCKEYLKKEPVFVSSSKDMDVSDLTLEKVITSRSPLASGSKDSIIAEEEKDPVKVLEQKAHSFVSLLNHKNELRERAENYCETDEEKTEIRDFFASFEIGKSSLVTEYHLMAIYKAAELGRPVIVDEVNLIRPEIFMALNDILTRRVGQSIQLPNALGSITVKPGFCIIMTGNDPDQNAKKKRYAQGRYTFDEASYNRLRVYAKSYAKQKEDLFDENRVDTDTLENESEQYLADNELYGILLQMMLSKDGELMRSTKYGFEIMKRNMDGESMDRTSLFTTLKSLSIAISNIQNAYAWNKETLRDPRFKTISLSTSIKRKVFSMRNLLEVYESYKTDIRPMEYHLYREFIQHTTNEDEQYALLAIFHENGFFTGLITDNIQSSLENIKKLFGKLELMTLSIHDIENKVIITRQDVAHEYFGGFHFPDSVFHGVDLSTSASEDETTSEDILETVNEATSEDMETYCDTLESKIMEHFDLFSSDEHSLLGSIITAIRSAYVENFSSQSSRDRSHMAGLLIITINTLGEDTVSPEARNEFMGLMKRMGIENTGK